ncbi:hypothetical protein BC829DRAFT_463182 [Chytridium lagenaria]|nr:hypothetical protein BC829DRAFT_463182 [Chytridium lagenaria]
MPSVQGCASGVKKSYPTMEEASAAAQTFANCMCGTTFSTTAPMYQNIVGCTGCISNSKASSVIASMASLLTGGEPTLPSQATLAGLVMNLQTLPKACDNLTDRASGYLQVLQKTQVLFTVKDQVIKPEDLAKTATQKTTEVAVAVAAATTSASSFSGATETVAVYGCVGWILSGVASFILLLQG